MREVISIDGGIMREEDLGAAPARPGRRRIDVLIGFSAGIVLWSAVFAGYIWYTEDTDSVASGTEELASFETAAGVPSPSTVGDALDNRVNKYRAGDFRLGMPLSDVIRVTRDLPYVENAVWPTKLEEFAGTAADGQLNFFGADDKGIASYVLDFCGGFLARITVSREYASANELQGTQNEDGRGTFSDLELMTLSTEPNVVLSRTYHHLYDSGQSARLSVSYEHGPKYRRILVLSDAERCQLQSAMR